MQTFQRVQIQDEEIKWDIIAMLIYLKNNELDSRKDHQFKQQQNQCFYKSEKNTGG